MLQQIDSAHLAALEAELARVTAQRDALRNALAESAKAMGVASSDCIEDFPHISSALYARTLEARAALQACQD